MARYVKFNLDQYGTEGTIPLYRGDDWSLPGKVILKRGDQIEECDLSDVIGASAFFPAASGGVLQGGIAISDAICGRILLSLPASGTVNALLSSAGVAPYIVLEESGLSTIPTIDQPLQIMDPGFTNL